MLVLLDNFSKKTICLIIIDHTYLPYPSIVIKRLMITFQHPEESLEEL